MRVMIRTLGPAWIGAAIAALGAMGLLAAALLWPMLAPPPPEPPGKEPAGLFAALTAGEGDRLREELRGLVPSLAPAPRARLEAMLAAEEKRVAEAPPGFVMAGIAGRLEAALQRHGSAAPPPGLLLATAMLALLAALLALLASPLALAPLQAMQAARGRGWGLERRDLWGVLARDLAAATPEATPATAAFPPQGMEMELAEWRLRGAEALRGLRDAAAAGAQMVAVAQVAEQHLDRATLASERAADSLPRFAAVQAEAVTAMTGQLDRVAVAAGLAERLESVLPPLLRTIEAQAVAGTGDIAEMEAMALRLDAAATRLAAEAEAMPTAAAELRAAAEAMAPAVLVPVLAEAAAEARAVQDMGAARLETAVAELGRTLAELAAAQPEQAAGLAALEAALAALPEAQAEAAAQVTAALAALPEAQAELAQRVEAAFAPLAALPEAQAELAQRVEAVLAPLAALPEAQAELAQRVEATLAPLAALPDAQAELAQRVEAAFAPLATLPDTRQDIAARVDAAAERLDHHAACISVASARLLATLPEVEGLALARLALATGTLEATLPALHSRAAQIEQAAADMPRALGDQLGRMAGRLDQAVDRAEAILATAEVAAPRQPSPGLAAASEPLAAARQAPPQPAWTMPEESQHSVAAALLGTVGADTAPAVTATLHRLDGVETEVARLLREAEAMAEGSLDRHAFIPGLVVERAPELLDSLDITIRRLQSVATAIAMASDRSLQPAR